MKNDTKHYIYVQQTTPEKHHRQFAINLKTHDNLYS